MMWRRVLGRHLEPIKFSSSACHNAFYNQNFVVYSHNKVNQTNLCDAIRQSDLESVKYWLS